MIKPEEKKLIVLLQQEDTTAVKLIFDQYHAPLCQVAYAIVLDREEAKDVVQEVFLKLWRNRKKLAIEISLFAYLKRAVTNTAINSLEKQKRVSSLVSGGAGQEYFMGNDTDQQQLSNELSALAEKAIANLPSRTKAVFRLIRSEEMSYKEVAGALDISLKAVEKEMMKALRLLRQALKDYLPVLFIWAILNPFYFF